MCITNNCTIWELNRTHTCCLLPEWVQAKLSCSLQKKTHVDKVVNQQLLYDQVYGRWLEHHKHESEPGRRQCWQSRRARAKPDEPEREKTKPEYKEDQTWATRVVRVRGKNDERRATRVMKLARFGAEKNLWRQFVFFFDVFHTGYESFIWAQKKNQRSDFQKLWFRINCSMRGPQH